MTISSVFALRKPIPILIIASALWGCASTRIPEPASEIDRDHFEVTCEIALLRLERLIEMRAAQKTFPLAMLLEAKELQKIGKQLYLEREYALALELIGQGIELVEEDRG